VHRAVFTLNNESNLLVLNVMCLRFFVCFDLHAYGPVNNPTAGTESRVTGSVSHRVSDYGWVGSGVGSDMDSYILAPSI